MVKISETFFKEVYNDSNKHRLFEFSTEEFYHLLTDNLLRRHVNANEHAKMIANVFGNIKNYQYDENHNRVESVNTHLQDSNGNYCTKQEFENDFLHYEFDNQVEANSCLECLLEKFDDDGWLIIKS